MSKATKNVKAKDVQNRKIKPKSKPVNRRPTLYRLLFTPPSNRKG